MIKNFRCCAANNSSALNKLLLQRLLLFLFIMVLRLVFKNKVLKYPDKCAVKFSYK